MRKRSPPSREKAPKAASSLSYSKKPLRGAYYIIIYELAKKDARERRTK